MCLRLRRLTYGHDLGSRPIVMALGPGVAALCSTALRDQQRVSAKHLRLTLVGGDGLADDVRDLAVRETDCCSFFDFTVTPTAAVVVLDIEVPADYVGVLDGLSALANSAVATAVR